MAIRPLCVLSLLLVSLFAAVPAYANCGAEGQRACVASERQQRCDVNLVEANGSCNRPTCGREGERGCNVTERFGQVCDSDLAHDLLRNVCEHPTRCGRAGQRACRVTQRLQACDTDLININGSCVRPECGRLGEPFCSGSVASRYSKAPCDTNLVTNPTTRLCERPGQSAGASAQAGTVHGAAPVNSGQPAPPSSGTSPPPPPPARSGPPSPPLPAVASGGTSSPPGAAPPLPPGAVAGTTPPPPLPAVAASTAPPSAAPPDGNVPTAGTGPAVSSSANGVTLSAPATVMLGEWITVDWLGPSRSRDYIVLAAPGTAPGLSQSIAYGGTRNSPVSLRPPRSPGAYEIWYLDDARRQILHRTTVSIVAPAGSTAVQPVAGGPAAASTNGVTLVAPLTVRLGEWISVEWTGPSNSQDYIVLAARGTAPGLRESIAYGGARNSPVSLRPPRAPGAYEVWYLDDARKQILHRVPVAITP